MDYRKPKSVLADTSTSRDTRTTEARHHQYDFDIPVQTLRGYGEQDSETSSNSEVLVESGNMDRDYNGYERDGRGGNRSGRGGSRAYSNSSGSSNGQFSSNRSTLKPATVPHGRTTPPDRVAQMPALSDLRVTPTKQRSTFNLSGHHINETFTARRSSATSPPRQLPLSPSASQSPSFQHCYSRSGQNTTVRPVMKEAEKYWAYQQESKIKLLGLPRSFWTKEVYQAMSRYGNVVRVEMQPNARDNNAWVVFQPPPPRALPVSTINVGATSVRYEVFRPLMASVPSPVNSSRQYYEVNILPATAIDFGIRVAEKAMITMHSVRAQHGIQMMLNLKRKQLDVQFLLHVDRRMRKFRFRLPIALLSHVYKVSDRTTGQATLVIPFSSPPQFFMQKQEGENIGDDRTHTSFSNKEKVWHDWSMWFRETDIIDGLVKKRLQELPLMNHKDTAIIDIGRWTNYRVSLDSAILASPKFREFSDALADHGVAIEDLDHYNIRDKMASPLWTLLQEEISGTHPHLEASSKDSVFDDLFASQIHLNFPVRYQLEACLSNGYLQEHNITDEFLSKLSSLDSRHAVYILEKVVDKQYVYYDPMAIFDIRIKGSLEKTVPSYCTLQRSVIITPTTMHVASPIMETSNRIIRKYAADADRFIRVKFSDEKTEGQLRNMPDGRAEAVFDRVRRAMKHGIVVAGRYYEFLAFGNSQFREHGAYFYAATSSKSAEDIRMSLGHFEHIRIVAKFGARLGQCFSTTRAMTVSVKVNEILDVERNGYTFTDGVGKLPLFLAQMAAQELGLSHAFDDPPSLYQFRLGGCKGVLALDPTITGHEVHIRPSQQKFAAEFTGLEIIRSSSLATPFFNRQIIIVMSHLGVPNHIFIRKQQEMVNDYEHAMTDADVAVQKLRKHIDMNQTTLTMAGMVLDGFMTTQEPFMMSLLKLWRAVTIKNLKEKARIAIEDGAFVLGCVDETATLKGHMDDPQSRLDATQAEKLATLPEIFLQVDDSNSKGHYKIVEGICVLARNPSLHPGDLRVVRAVNVPALHHLKNVVVLPQTGERDLANMCSGGDLDGDDYMVLWDTDLLPENINVPPMDFTPEKPIESARPITVADISEFFVTYMKNDSLGQIAHAHLAQADANIDGVSSSTCLELAKLHSQAVDYPKSGIQAIMNRELRPNKWPHFMEKKHMPESKIYKSKKVLGLLYDQVKLVDFNPHWKNTFDDRVINAYQLDEPLLNQATEIKAAYDEALKRLMAKHGIRTEFEAWTVFVLGHNHESRDYKFSEEFGRTIGALKAQFREICRNAAGVTSVDLKRLGPFAAAMYTVTAREMIAALKECQAKKTVGGQQVPVRLMEAEHMPLMSFPWLFAGELGKIATGAGIDSLHQSDPFQLQQGLPRRPKKSTMISPDTNVGAVGTVETGTGITHYSELLNLDFGLSRTESEEKEKENVKQKESGKPTVTGQDRLDSATKVSKLQKQGIMSKDGESEFQEETATAKVEAKRPSALDKLMRMG